ncbi:MAG: CSLREA domain-containing protein, partial [Acidobacteriota bacterium]
MGRAHPLTWDSSFSPSHSDVLVETLGNPLSFALGDFDADGAMDWASGWAFNGRGYLIVQYGTIGDSPFCTAAGKGCNPKPTFSDDSSVFLTIPLEFEPVFLVAGDFDADGRDDLTAADPERAALWRYSFDNSGELQDLSEQPLGGQVTALVSGEINRRDGFEDLVVAIESTQGAAILIFESPSGSTVAESEILMSGIVDSLALADFDRDGLYDIASSSETDLTITWGRPRFPRTSAWTRHPNRDPEQSRIEFTSPIRAIVAGDFIGDERTEIATLFEGGKIEFVAFEGRGTPTRMDAAPLPGPHIPQSLAYSENRPAARIPLAATRLSSTQNDDLVISTPGSHQIQIIRFVKGAAIKPESAILNLDSDVIRVLPGNLDRDPFKDLVLLQSDGTVGWITTTLQSSFKVNSQGDEEDADPGDGACDVDLAAAGPQCTLRAAIEEANVDPGLDEITFTAGIGTLSPQLSLPAIKSAVILDGLSERQDKVEIDGSGLRADTFGGVIDLRGGSSVVFGLVINRSPRPGISLRSGGHTVEECFIGTDRSGTVPLENSANGITVYSSDNILRGNVLSGNRGDGIELNSSATFSGVKAIADRNLIVGNWIGTDSSGTIAIPNGQGIEIRGIDNQIGGSDSESRNIISGNRSIGVFISGFSGNKIQGNLIGLDASASQVLGNGENGIEVSGEGHLIGGLETGQGNVIGGNGFETTCRFPQLLTCLRDDGIHVRGNSTRGILIQGNYIGTNEQGDQLPNAANGIGIQGPSTTEVGGEDKRAENQIRFNGEHGILIDGYSTSSNKIINNTIEANTVDGVHIITSSLNEVQSNTISQNGKGGVVICGSGPPLGNSILGNSIDFNGSLGIDLQGGYCGDEGVTPNDASDIDDGPNGLQNFPTLIRVGEGSNVQVQLSSKPSATYRVEFFSSESCDDSGFGEGKIFLESLSLTLTTDQNGEASQVITAPSAANLTATATEFIPSEDPDTPGGMIPGNTSEFSACLAESTTKPFLVNSTGDSPDDNAQGESFDGICSTGKKLSNSSQPCNPTIEGDCECTLRAALQEANAREGADQIHFGIPESVAEADGTFTIYPDSVLPQITDPIQIDGFTQPGANPDATSPQPWKLFEIKIVLDGSRAGAESDGLTIDTSDSTVRGLALHSFGRHGITIWGADNNLQKNHIGMDASGVEAQDKGEGTIGVWLLGARQNRVGPENMITGFGVGVQLQGQNATGNQIDGNLVGADQ